MVGLRHGAAFLILLFVSPSASAQSSRDYLDLTERYLDAPEDSAAALATWPLKAVEDGAMACLQAGAGTCSQRQRAAAAMLHTEVAKASIFITPKLAASHVRLARRLLASLERRDGFVERWFEFMTLVYLSENFVPHAEALASDGLERFPQSGRLHAASGTVTQLRHTMTAADLRGFYLGRDRMPPAMSRAVGAAEISLRRALKYDPTLDSARLRLAWGLMLQRDGRAKPELATVLAENPDGDRRYLANLLLGTIAERERRLDDAQGAYEAARSAGPFYQTGCVALSHLHDLRGRRESALAVALSCLSLPRAEDPWWYFRYGSYDTRLLDWLRAEVKRQ